MADFKSIIDSEIRAYLENNFSEKTWSCNLFLQRVAEEHGGTGAIPVRIFLAFTKIEKLLHDAGFRGHHSDSKVNRLCEVVEGGGHLCTIEVCYSATNEISFRRKSLPTTIRQEIESYFIDENYQRNRFLQELARKRGDGYIPLAEVVTTERMKSLLNPQTRVDEIARTLIGSTVVELKGNLLRKREYADEFDNRSFSVLQFNVLAQMYATKISYPHADPSILDWRHRFKKIIEIIITSEADLVCLQEVQGLVFKDWYKSVEERWPHAKENHANEIAREAKNHGFACLYWRKKPHPGKEREVDLGNMILYRTTVFATQEAGAEIIPYSMAIREMCPPLISVEQERRYLSAKHFAIALRLRHLASQKELLVVSTHIVCCPQDPDIQFAQVYALTQALRRRMATDGVPVVLCGDFNAQPDDAIYRFLQYGALSGDESILAAHNGVESIFPREDNGGLFSGLDLTSAYFGREPPVTNIDVQKDFRGCLDYIFVSRTALEVTGLRPIPSMSTLEVEGGGLPNTENPSDHIPIGATFRFLEAEQRVAVPIMNVQRGISDGSKAIHQDLRSRTYKDVRRDYVFDALCAIRDACDRGKISASEKDNLKQDLLTGVEYTQSILDSMDEDNWNTLMLEYTMRK
jgi:mRNA deadenylase 3'-5' endonuclease subunit Ccr4